MRPPQRARVASQYEIPNDECQCAENRHQPDENVIARLAGHDGDEREQNWKAWGVQSMRLEVELVTPGCQDVVRKSHVHGGIRPVTLNSLDRRDLENAEEQQTQDNRTIGSAEPSVGADRSKQPPDDLVLVEPAWFGAGGSGNLQVGRGALRHEAEVARWRLSSQVFVLRRYGHLNRPGTVHVRGSGAALPRCPECTGVNGDETGACLTASAGTPASHPSRSGKGNCPKVSASTPSQC